MGNRRTHDLAERIRTGTAWWSEAARALDEGRTEGAASFAALGTYGLEGLREDIGTEVAR